MMRRFPAWLVLLPLLGLNPDPAEGQLCYPGMSLCFAPNEFFVVVSPGADPLNPSITGTTILDQITGAWSFWDTEWTRTRLHWDLVFSNGTVLSRRAAGMGIAGSGTGEPEHTIYDTGGSLQVGADPSEFPDPWTVTLTGLQTYGVDPDRPLYECGTPDSFPCATVPGPGNVVPEPSTVILLATGLIGLGVVAWRRKDQEVE